MHVTRRGSGKPLLLVHGLGGSWRSWSTITDALAGERELIVPDLPGFGATPPLPGAPSFLALADALEAFLRERGSTGIDAVGSSMGARLVLELARRKAVGATVALDPGGFWSGWERPFFESSIGLSIALVRAIRPALPMLANNPVTRTALFAQFSARPWELPSEVALDELRSFAASPSFDAVLRDLARGPAQAGAPRGSIEAPLVIGWGRADRVCLPQQAARALAAFPDARLHWFDRCGHFPQWDAPAETVRLILTTTM
ncbi:MAG: alpha/beta fold hydrolase [Vulcanimicrobiaceae bacterium]